MRWFLAVVVSLLMPAMALGQTNYNPMMNGLIGINPGAFNNTMDLPFTFLLGGINPVTEYEATQGSTFLQIAAVVGGVSAPANSTTSMNVGLAG